MKKACFQTLCWLVASTGLSTAATLSSVELTTSETDEPEPRQSEIVVSFSDPSISEGESRAAIAEALGIEDMAAFGIERLYYENDPDADWRVYFDSRLVLRPDDFSVRFEASKADEKYLNVDFDFWEEYDYGAGIYYPARDAFYLLDPDTLVEELLKFKVSYRFLPSFSSSWKISYSLFERSGESLSTRFGDDYQYSLRGVKSRGIVPALSTGKETVQTVDLAYQKNDGINRKGVRLHAQRRESERSRITERGAADPAVNRYQTHQETSKDDLFAASAFTRKQLTDTIYGSVGIALTRLDGDITGSRVFGADPEASYDIDFAASQFGDRGFLDLDGSRKLKQWIVNANLVYQPEGHFRWMAGARYERLSSEAFSSYLDTWDTFDYGDLERQNQESSMVSSSEKDANDFSAFLEVRYNRFTRAQIYSRVEVGQQDGDLYEEWSAEELVPNAAGALSLLDRATGFDRSRFFWETGVNYNPTNAVRLSLEGYIKSRENEYDYARLVRPGTDWTDYPGFIEEQEFQTEDVNARVSWRLFPWLKSVSRIDVQNTTIESKARSLDELESADRRRVVFNQGIVLTPHPRFFMNASYQLVDDLTETAATDDLRDPFDGIIVNIPNDYWQVDVNVFYVVSKIIDLQLAYNYLEMTNYLDTSPMTVPYGNDIEQHHGSVDFIFRLSKSKVARLGYHYYEQTEAAAAGNKDYSVHLLRTSLQHKF